MAIYSTVFLCEPRQLLPAFPGWKLPLAQPVTRTRVNPFTQEGVTVQTTEPEWDDADEIAAPSAPAAVVAVEGDYAAYLESRIPEFVRRQPHWCTKGLTSYEFDPLVEAVTGETEARLQSALYAHPTIPAGIEQFPNDFVLRLSEARSANLEVFADNWASAMSTPDRTHSPTGERVRDDWKARDAHDVLTSIAQLASRQQAEQAMFLLTEV